MDAAPPSRALAVLAPVWPDPSWHVALGDAIVSPMQDARGTIEEAPAGWSRAGTLRHVDRLGAGVVNLDGET